MSQTNQIHRDERELKQSDLGNSIVAPAASPRALQSISTTHGTTPGTSVAVAPRNVASGQERIPGTGLSAVITPPRTASRIEYICPGESHAISRSVHLARLIAGYAACRHCVHRHDHGVVKTAADLESNDAHNRGGKTGRESLVTPEGIRGIYLNELGRSDAADWGAAFASMMWDEQPRLARSIEEQIDGTPSTARNSPDHPRLGSRSPVGDSTVSPDQCQCVRQPTPLSPGSHDVAPPEKSLNATLDAIDSMPTIARRYPTVVVGFDERSSSPDIVVGIAQGLRRMGCDVVDLGQISNPCFRYAIHHLNSAGGIYVTGSGYDPCWTGMNVAGRGALPWLEQSILEQFESRAKSKVVRPTRTAGTQRPFHATVPYEAGLSEFFHALRPLNIVCGTSCRLLRRTLESLFARLPCGLTMEQLPVRRRDLNDPRDPDVRRVAANVVANKKHLGLIIDDDGERCAFLTEEGRLLSPAQTTTLLINLELRDHPSVMIVTDQPLLAALGNWPSSRRSKVQKQTIAPSKLPASMAPAEATLGCSSDHRYWFRGAYPMCDGILTLGHVLQSLSLSDASMSEVLSRLASA